MQRERGIALGVSLFRREKSKAKRATDPSETISIDDMDILVRRKNVKNISLYVKAPDGRVEVTAPYRLSVSEIGRFVREKRGWIASKREGILSSPQRMAEEASPAQIAEWRSLVEVVVPPLIEKWETILGVKSKSVVYRNMKSRWGSCNPSTGRICINIRLALYSPECLEYVVVHELCHLIERGHGPRFHALLDSNLPNWRESRRKLR